MWPELARTTSVSGSAPSASARLRPHLTSATPEQHRVFLLGARAAAAHRHGLLPRTRPMTTSAVGLLGPEEYGGPEAARDLPHAPNSRLPRLSLLLFLPSTCLLALSLYFSLSFLPIYFPPSSPFHFSSQGTTL